MTPATVSGACHEFELSLDLSPVRRKLRVLSRAGHASARRPEKILPARQKSRRGFPPQPGLRSFRSASTQEDCRSFHRPVSCPSSRDKATRRQLHPPALAPLQPPRTSSIAGSLNVQSRTVQVSPTHPRSGHAPARRRLTLSARFSSVHNRHNSYVALIMSSHGPATTWRKESQRGGLHVRLRLLAGAGSSARRV